MLYRAAPFAIITPAFIAGVALASDLAAPAGLCAGLLIAAGCLAVLLRRDILLRWTFAVLAVASAGALRYAQAEAALRAATAEAVHGTSVVLEGMVDDEPDVRPGEQRLRVQATRLSGAGADLLADRPLSHAILIRTDAAIPWRYGDRLRAAGVLDTPPVLDTFDYRAYLARKGVLSWMPSPDRIQRLGTGAGSPAWGALLQVKDWLRVAVQRMMAAPESALLNGILIGDDNGLPPTVQNAFRLTGTSHLVAISGFNVSLVVAALAAGLGRLLDPRRAALVAIPVVCGYVLFVGASASVLRAGGMALVALTGQCMGRRGYTLNTLCAASGLVLLADPQLLYDAGFQLSVAATLGLVLYADRLQKPAQAWMEARVPEGALRRIAGIGLEGFLVTLAAQLTTIPLLVVQFEALSILGIFTNVLVLPLQPPVMGLGFAAGALGVFWPQGAQVAAWPAYALLTITLRIIEGMATLPSVSVPVHGAGIGLAAAYYAVLLAWTIGIALPARVQARVVAGLRSKPAGAAAPMVALSAVVVAAGVWWTRPDGRLHVVLEGSGAFVQTPAGRQFVFGSGAHVLSDLGRGMPLLDQQLEWLMLARRDDRARGAMLPVLRRYWAETVLIPPVGRAGPDEPSAMRDEWDAALQAEGIREVEARPGQEFAIDDGVILTLVPASDGALAGRIAYGRVRIALLGDVDVVSGTLGAQSDLLFLTPRTRGMPLVARAAPSWLVWADTAGAAPAVEDPHVRVIALRERRRVEFVSDGRTLALITP